MSLADFPAMKLAGATALVTVAFTVARRTALEHIEALFAYASQPLPSKSTQEDEGVSTHELSSLPALVSSYVRSKGFRVSWYWTAVFAALDMSP